jgi:hypothetical protein
MRPIVLMILFAGCSPARGPNVSDLGAVADLLVAPTPLGKLGTLVVTTIPDNTPAGTVLGSFYDATSGRCARSRVGPCEATVCTSTLGGQGDSAGNLTITGGAQPVTITPMGGVYSAGPLANPWPSGTVLGVAAAGATVPSFSTSVKMPGGPIQITGPALAAPTGPQLTFARGSDVTFTFTGGTDGQLELSLTSSANSYALLKCGFAAAAGSGTVPAAALALLPSGLASLTAESVDRKVLSAGDYLIDVTAEYVAMQPQPQGGTYNIGVQLQ